MSSIKFLLIFELLCSLIIMFVTDIQKEERESERARARDRETHRKRERERKKGKEKNKYVSRHNM